MNKDILVNYLSEYLNLKEAEKDFAFRLLIKKVSERLNFNDALRIDNIGVFQLKKEPLPRQERAGLLATAAKERRTLIYSPPFENLKEDFNSVFLTLDLDELNISSSEDLDKVFSISVNQPLIPLFESNADIEKIHVTSDSSTGNELEVKISQLVYEGTILKNYDVWDEYLNRDKDKIPGTDAIDDAEDIAAGTSFTIDFSSKLAERVEPEPEVEEPETEIYIEDKPKTKLDDELRAFEEMAQLEGKYSTSSLESFFDDDSDSTQNADNIEDIIDETKSGEFGVINQGIIKDGISDNEPFGSVDLNDNELPGIDAPGYSSLEKLDDLLDMNEVELEEKEDDIDKSMFDELEEYLKEEDDEDDDNLKEEAGILKAEDEMSNDSEEREKNEIVEDISDSTEPFYTRSWFIISSIVIVLAVISMFVFIPQNDDLPLHETVQDSLRNSEQPLTSPGEDMPVITETSVKTEPEISKPASAEQTGLYRKIPNDIQAANQVYFDGKVYTVQVSSWRNSAIAEREVEKLRKREFDAFIYQIYLESKSSTWNRVRIGYFNSVTEAENFLAKNKF
jgi:cell division septation protein DedD/nucleoid DNA-binding protein